MNRSTIATVFGGAGILGASALGVALIHDSAQAAPVSAPVAATSPASDAQIQELRGLVRGLTAALASQGRAPLVVTVPCTKASTAQGSGQAASAGGRSVVVYRVAPAPRATTQPGTTVNNYVTQVTKVVVSQSQGQGQQQTQTVPPAPPVSVPTPPAPVPSPTPTGPAPKPSHKPKHHDGGKGKGHHKPKPPCTCTVQPPHGSGGAS